MLRSGAVSTKAERTPPGGAAVSHNAWRIAGRARALSAMRPSRDRGPSWRDGSRGLLVDASGLATCSQLLPHGLDRRLVVVRRHRVDVPRHEVHVGLDDLAHL